MFTVGDILKSKSPEKPKVKWLGKLTVCQICGGEFGVTFIDGAMARGSWAIMCKACHNQIGCGLGVGRGQEYDTQTREKIRG